MPNSSCASPAEKFSADRTSPVDVMFQFFFSSETRFLVANQEFYVGSTDDGHRLTGYVPAKFLTSNGQPVVDPTPGGSQNAYLYADASDRYKTNGKIANPNNYIIVPANYSEQQARAFAADVANSVDALGKMHAAFVQGGPQDLQRNPQWGVPEGSVVPAFVSGASYYLGSVTGSAGLPPQLSEIGGGIANLINGYVVQPLRSLRHKRSTEIDTSGPWGLSPQNYGNFTKGYADATTVPDPQWLASGLGSGSPSQGPAGQIGDGRGIAGWISSLYGIDPSNPTQPVPQQQTTGPLGLVTNQPMPQWPVPPPIFDVN